MKKFNKVISIIFFMMTIILLVSCGDTTDNKISISLNKVNLTLKIDDTFQFEATVLNSTLDVLWTVEDETVISITDTGLVTGLKVGVTKVKATVGKVFAEADIVVAPKVSTDFPVLTLSQEEVELLENGDPFTVTAHVYLDGEIVETLVEWIVLDENIATVLNGVITPVAVGATTITVSTTYMGELLEKIIAVSVKIDAALTLDVNVLELNTVKVGDLGKTSATITATATESGVVNPDANITFTTTDDDLIQIVATANEVEITALKVGKATVIASFMVDDQEVIATINVNIVPINIDLKTTFEVDLIDTETYTLDLSNYDFKDKVIEIKKGNAVISDSTNKATISESWLSLQTIDTNHNINIITSGVIYQAVIRIVKGYQNLELSLVEGLGGSSLSNYDENLADVGFKTGDDVYKYNSGTSGGWDGRLQFSHSGSGYDYLIFDLYTNDQALTSGYFVFWLGFNHVFQVDSNGDIGILEAGPNYKGGINYLKIFDNEGNEVKDGMTTNQRYSIHIDLLHRGNDLDDLIAFSKEITMYLGNPIFVTKGYYERIYGPIDIDPEPPADDESMEIIFKLTADKASGDKFTEVIDQPKMYEFTSVSASAWANRLQVQNPSLRNYDYIVFDFMLTKELTKRMIFWMDMRVGKEIIYNEGNFSENLITVYNPDGFVHEGILEANINYTFVIKLLHGDPEYRYAFGFDEATNVFISNTYAVIGDVLEDFIPELNLSKQLADAKEAAKLEVDNLFEQFLATDFSPDKWIEFTMKYTSTLSAIDEATSIEDVTILKNAGILEMESVESLLPGFKVIAKEDINNEFLNYKEEDYLPADWQLLISHKNAGLLAVDESNTSLEIGNHLNATILAMSKVMTAIERENEFSLFDETISLKAGSLHQLDFSGGFDSYALNINNIIKLDDNGLVRAIAPGLVELEVTINNLKGRYTFNVLNPVEGIDLIDFYVDVESGRDIRLLQLTDTQIIDASQKRTPDRLTSHGDQIWAPSLMYENVFKYIDNAVSKSNPDFIFLTGDNVYGEFDDLGTSHEALINHMDSYKIPWAMTFGNHDLETKKGIAWQIEQYKNSKYGLFTEGTVTGYSNYTVGFTQNGTLKRVMYLLDTHGTTNVPSINEGMLKTTAGFAPDQIAWVNNVANQINNTVSYEVKGLAAWHIPSEHFRNALESKYPYPSVREVEYSFTIGDKTLPALDNDFGSMRSKFHDFSQSGIDDALVNAKIDGVFVGHVHLANTSILHNNIRWTFGLKTGTYDSHTPSDLGGTLATIGFQDNSLVVNHVYDNEYVGIKEDFVSIEFKLTEDATSGDTLVKVPNLPNTFEHTTVTESAWTNRVQVQSMGIRDFDYIVFELTLTEALTKRMVFWMDIGLGSANPFINGQDDKGVIKVYNPYGQIHTGALVANVKYTLVVELSHTDPEYRYAFGYDNATKAYISNAFAVKSNVLSDFIPELDLDYELNESKTNAKFEVNNQFSIYLETDYTSEKWDELIQKKDDALNAINLATTTEEVLIAKNNGLSEMANVESLLLQFKLDAKAVVETEFQQYVEDDYLPVDWLILVGHKDTGLLAIDNALRSQDIEIAKNNTILAMNQVKTELQKAKESALSYLDTALVYEEQSVKVKGLLDEVRTLINESLTTTEITDLLNTYELKIVLELTKESGTEIIIQTFETYDENIFTGENYQELTLAKNNALQAISDATSIQEIEDAVATGLLAMASIPNDIELVRTSALDAINNLFNSLNEVDYKEEIWAQLLSVKDSAVLAISNGETVIEINEAETTGLLGMAILNGEQELLNIFSQYEEINYTNSDWLVMLDILDNVNLAISEASSVQDIIDSLDQATTLFNDVSTKTKQANFRFTPEKTHPETTYELTEPEFNTYKYSIGSTDWWANRLEASKENIGYKYLVFQLRIDNEQNSNYDGLIAIKTNDNPTATVSSNGISTSNKIRVFDSEGEFPPTIGLLYNSTYYIVVEINPNIKNTVFIGLNFITETIIINPVFVKEESINEIIPINQEHQFEFGTDDNAANVVITNKGENINEYTLLKEGAWDNRIEVNDQKITLYNYIIFDVKFHADPTKNITFWMSMTGSTMTFTPSTPTSVANIVVYNEEGIVVTDALLANTQYTFVIKLTHSNDFRYSVGLDESMTITISNARAITQKLHDELF